MIPPADADWDVLILGGGPAGSTAANLLATAGHRVLVLEKEIFPRFHIGESLLPGDFPTFERIGLDLDALPHVPKRGAEFLDERTGRRAIFDFADGLPGSGDRAIHVGRAEFDTQLLRNAEARGAAVAEGSRATHVRFSGTRVDVDVASANLPPTLHARYLIDATGQDSLLAKQQKSREALPGFGRAAAFRHLAPIDASVWDEEIAPRGDIRVLLIDQGWVWVIPLPNRTLSVGVVRTSGKIGPELLDAVFAESPTLQRLTRGAKVIEAAVVRNFSFRNRTPFGARYGCVGDAQAFLDPVFSNGVTLAMLGAERLADELGPALDEGREAEPDLMAAVSADIERGYATFERLVDRFYNSKFIDNILFAETPLVGIRQGLISVLSGDVWRNDNPFQALLMNARRRSRGSDLPSR